MTWVLIVWISMQPPLWVALETYPTERECLAAGKMIEYAISTCLQAEIEHE